MNRIHVEGAPRSPAARRPWHGSSNVLVLHGTHSRRDAAARGLHAAGLAAAGPFIAIDCSKEGPRFQALALAWMAQEACAPSGEPPVCASVTLFLDSVETLSADCQRLLVVLMERLAEAVAAGQPRSIARLIVGTSAPLEREVTAGRFLPELYDALDKVRLDLGSLGTIAHGKADWTEQQPDPCPSAPGQWGSPRG